MTRAHGLGLGQLALLLIGGAVGGPSRPPAAWGAPGAQPGFAAVVNAQGVSNAETAPIQGDQVDVGQLAATWRRAGLLVAEHPSGRCVAATAPTAIAEDVLYRTDLRPPVILAGMLEHATAEQVAARDQGYVPADVLSEPQRAPLLWLARRFRLVNEKGEPREEGMSLRVGMWPTWELWLALDEGGVVRTEKLPLSPAPPSLAVVETPPLDGSVLWWIWPYAEAPWGQEPVTLAAGTYPLDRLVVTLSRATGLTITADAEAADARLAIVAKDVPTKDLLWAIGVAAGLELRADGAVPGEVKLALVSPEWPKAPRKGTWLMPGVGYYNPALCPAGRQLLSDAAALDGQERTWLGWRYSDLPLLYRNWIRDIREAGGSPGEAPPAPIDPDRTVVLWVRGIHVSAGLLSPDLGGTSYECVMPAL